MTEEAFWTLVERAHDASEGDMDEKCALLTSELSEMPPEEVISFQARLNEAMDRAYTWPVWGAASIINGGCSDDSFMDFRATLISMGRDTFDSALKNPETLADLDLEDGEEFIYEGFQHVPSEVLEEIAPDRGMPSRTSPSEPTGKKWEEDDLEELFPRLSEKFG